MTTKTTTDKNTFQAFNVYKGRKLIDTVFYGNNVKVDKEEVRRSLISHDGYDHDITVTRRRGKLSAE